MAFDPVIFGTYVVGTGFTDGSSISEGGFRLFIVPSENIGDAPLEGYPGRACVPLHAIVFPRFERSGQLSVTCR
ncbi:hypothetical protein [Methanolobus sp. ZRKC5]|uniref:hypothetical protein n=1 Tax=unclassified Methanolobus TaxID=2629569 RepID=UPI00313A99DA